jgi:hypothetical protein
MVNYEGRKWVVAFSDKILEKLLLFPYFWVLF